MLRTLQDSDGYGIMLSSLTDAGLAPIIKGLQLKRSDIEDTENGAPLDYSSGAYLVRLNVTPGPQPFNVSETGPPRFEAFDVILHQRSQQRLFLGRTRPGFCIPVSCVSNDPFTEDDIECITRRLRAGELTDNTVVHARYLVEVKELAVSKCIVAAYIRLRHREEARLQNITPDVWTAVRGDFGDAGGFLASREYYSVTSGLLSTQLGRPTSLTAGLERTGRDARGTAGSELATGSVMPRITKANAPDFPPPDLRKQRSREPTSAAAIWYVQMMGREWNQSGYTYELAKGRHKRLLPDFQEAEREREQSRVRERGAKDSKQRRRLSD